MAEKRTATVTDPFGPKNALQNDQVMFRDKEKRDQDE